MNKNIAVIRGDGIGPEIVGEAIAVLDAVAEKFGHSFTYTEALGKVRITWAPAPDGLMIIVR